MKENSEISNVFPLSLSVFVSSFIFYFKVFTLKLLSAFALRGFKDLQGIILLIITLPF